MSLMRSPSRSAFTLVEIVTVVAIIIVLVAILVPVLGHVKQQAKTTAATSQLGALRLGLEQYFADFNMYPPSSPLIPGTTNPIYSAIPAGHGASMLAEALIGYLPGNVDGAGTSLNDPNDFGFRLTKTGSTMGGKIYGPYARFDSKTYSTDPTRPVANVFIDPWGDDILYYRSLFSAPSTTVPNVANIFSLASLNNSLFVSDDCQASTTLLSSVADPPTGNSPFFKLISAVGNNGATGRQVTGSSSYLLISAGLDQKYFTADDVVVSK